MANLRLPKTNQIVHGKRRELWVRDAYRALIASTDAAMLWKIVRVGGFLTFANVAPKAFSQFAGFDFTIDEVRVIFNDLDRYVTQLEKTDHAHMTVNRAARKFEHEEREEYLDDKILTDSITTATRAYTSGGQRIH